MKIKNGFSLYQVGGSYVVVPDGETPLDFNGMVTLNETGAFLWKLLEGERTREQLVEALLEEYDVSPKQAKQSVDCFAAELEENGFAQ